MKLVQVEKVGKLQPDAARALRRVLEEVPLQVTRAHLRPVELLAEIRRGSELQSPFWGYSGHLFGISIDIEWSAGAEEALNAHCWRATVRDSAALVDPKHFTYYGYGWKSYGAGVGSPEEARVLDLVQPYLDVAAPPAQMLGLDAADSGNALLQREALLAFQRAWLIPPSGELDLRTRVAGLAFSVA